MPTILADETVNIVGLEDIEDGGRGGVKIRKTKPSEIASLKTLFQSGDILYGKLRPYLNKVAIAPIEGMCSTEIWAFAAAPYVDSSFAHAFLTSSFFVQRVSSLTKGANLPRLDIATFESIEIPVPPLSEQRRIAELLHEANQIRSLRHKSDTTLARLVPAMFQQVIGDVVDNPRKWPLRSVSDFVKTFEAGKSLPDGGPERADGLRVLKISAVTSGRFDPAESKPAPYGYTPLHKHFVRPGDFLLSRANTTELVGATALVDECPPNILLPDKLWRVVWRVPEEVSPDFMAVLFRMPGVRMKISQIASGTGGSMKNISMDKLMALRLPLPQPEVQMKFSTAIRELRQIQYISGGSDRTTMLYSGLVAHALTGNLTAEWRASNFDLLRKEAGDRDHTSKGVHLIRSDSLTIEEAVSVAPHYVDTTVSELTRDQQAVLT